MQHTTKVAQLLSAMSFEGDGFHDARTKLRQAIAAETVINVLLNWGELRGTHLVGRFVSEHAFLSSRNSGTELQWRAINPESFKDSIYDPL